jgi:hypothetical protein
MPLLETSHLTGLVKNINPYLGKIMATGTQFVYFAAGEDATIGWYMPQGQ